ncbi:MAG: hypothetical protein QOJ35_2317 [Solirubrobacteraceae bacterium]|nr:hypothetical protein [Solirubrobacteraceae bacterium]
MTVAWDDELDAILAGDLTGGLGYRTPAGGVVVQAVAPIGLRDRAAGTIGFTTSLGFSKKLERIARDPRVAMAFHAREHGFAADAPQYVLVQGRAEVVAEPSAEQRDEILERSTRYLGKPASGPFWDRWLREYYDVRVPVRIAVERIVVWPDLRCAGSQRVVGAPAAAAPAPQKPPKNGTGPRVKMQRAGRRVRGSEHVLLGFGGADGFPVVVPVRVEHVDERGMRLGCDVALPQGGRRAGLLGHSYRPKLVGLTTRQYTGWLEVGADGRALYAPHTETGYVAPPNKTLLLLLNGGLAKKGVRTARKAAAAGG